MVKQLEKTPVTIYVPLHRFECREKIFNSILPHTEKLQRNCNVDIKGTVTRIKPYTKSFTYVTFLFTKQIAQPKLYLLNALVKFT